MGKKLRLKKQRQLERQEQERQLAETKKRKISRRNFLIGGTSLVSLGVGIGLFFSNTNNNISFQEAKQDPSRRRDYIEQLEKRLNFPSYVSDISYLGNHLEEGEKGDIYQDRVATMSTSGNGGTFREIGTKKINSSTKVYDAAFKLRDNETDLIASLNHEKNMAKILYYGFEDIPLSWFYIEKDGKERFSVTLLKLIAELESYDLDIKSARANKISVKYLQDTKKTYARHYSFLDDKNLPVKPKVASKLKEMFARPWTD